MLDNLSIWYGATVVSITERKGRPRADQREELLETLRRTTEHLLGEGRSYTEISVNGLCREAGVNRSTFYLHFEDKGHLLRELAGSALAEVAEIAREWWSNADVTGADETERIATRMFETYQEHGLLFAAFADTAVYDPVVRQVYDGLMATFADEMQRLVEDAQRDGRLQHDVPAEEVSQMLIWMIERTCYQMVRGANEEQIRRLARATALIARTVAYGQPTETS